MVHFAITVLAVVFFLMILGMGAGKASTAAEEGLDAYMKRNYSADTFERPTIAGLVELFKFLFKGVFVLGFMPGLIYACCMFCKYVAN